MNQSKLQKLSFEAQALPQLEHLYSTAQYMLDNESEAQDLVHESFSNAYHSWNKYLCDRDRRVWLFRIMVDALGNRREPSPAQFSAISSIDEIAGYLYSTRLANQQSIEYSVSIPFSKISQSEVKNAIRNLPDDFRLIVVLSLLEGFSYREVAEIAGIYRGIVRSRLHQGRKLLQRELFDHVACDVNDDILVGRVRSRRTG